MLNVALQNAENPGIQIFSGRDGRIIADQLLIADLTITEWIFDIVPKFSLSFVDGTIETSVNKFEAGEKLIIALCTGLNYVKKLEDFLYGDFIPILSNLNQYGSPKSASFAMSMAGVLDCGPEFFNKHSKSHKDKTSFDIFKAYADENKFDFKTNVKNTQDSQIWINSRGSWLDFFTHIQEHSFSKDNDIMFLYFSMQNKLNYMSYQQAALQESKYLIAQETSGSLKKLDIKNDINKKLLFCHNYDTYSRANVHNLLMSYSAVHDEIFSDGFEQVDIYNNSPKNTLSGNLSKDEQGAKNIRSRYMYRGINSFSNPIANYAKSQNIFSIYNYFTDFIKINISIEAQSNLFKGQEVKFPELMDVVTFFPELNDGSSDLIIAGDYLLIGKNIKYSKASGFYIVLILARNGNNSVLGNNNSNSIITAIGEKFKSISEQAKNKK